MDVVEAIRARYSCRSYQDRGIHEDTLRRLFDVARMAPSARNIQEWRFVVVRDPETRAKLATASCNQEFVGKAPVVLACCADGDNRKMTCGQFAYPIDLAIIIDHLTLLATAEGLATCWIGAFHADQVREILGIPERVEIVELLTLGYPADAAPEKSRMDIDQITRYEHW